MFRVQMERCQKGGNKKGRRLKTLNAIDFALPNPLILGQAKIRTHYPHNL